MAASPRKRTLTELTIRKAHPEKRVYLIWDVKQRGLALQVQPTGSRAWKVIYPRHGRTRWLHLGSADAIALSDARMLAAEVMLEVARGKDPAADRRTERSSGTFAELAARYVEEHAKKHNRSWKHADAQVQRFLIPTWGKLAAQDISRSDVKALMRRIEAPSLANLVLANTSAIFSWAVREELVTTNPCSGVTRNPVRSRDRVLSDSEIPQFWTAFAAAGPAGAVLKTILCSGQRPGECTRMRSEHLVDGWWTMPGEPVAKLGWPGTKNGRSHRVWLSQVVQDLIRARNDGFVFGTRVQGIDRTMQRICTRIGCERATPHDLRRTFGSTVTRLGFGRQAMDRILNHADRSVGSVYDRHGYADEDQHIMEVVAAHIVALVEGRPGDNVLTFEKR
jgi:integrase